MKGAKGKGAVRISKEALKPVDERKVGKRKAPVKVEKSSKQQVKNEKGAKKDPNKPKRPPSAFFVFLEEFRKDYKRENPNAKGVAVVGKAGGEKWKSMSVAEKAVYEAKAGKRKTEYEKLLKAYNKNQASSINGGGDGKSQKSKSEVDDADEASDDEQEDDDENDEEDDD